jgi:hypothetical protein
MERSLTYSNIDFVATKIHLLLFVVVKSQSSYDIIHLTLILIFIISTLSTGEIYTHRHTHVIANCIFSCSLTSCKYEGNCSVTPYNLYI